MSTDRKLLIGAGALLLVLMSSIIAFSVGVYVGVKGWGTEPSMLPSQPARQQQAAPGNLLAPQAGPPADQAPMPEERPAMTGLLVNGNRSMIALRTRDGVRQVLVDQSLVVTRWDGEAMKPADLERGMALALFGEFDGDEEMWRIDRIVVLPPAEERESPAQ